MFDKKRIVYIDIMKGILITLVVIGHLHFFEYNSRTLTLIYSFHMSAFLIIGGMLNCISTESKYFEIIIKRIKNCLIPYILFCIISLVLIPVFPPENKIKAFYVFLSGLGEPNYSINLPLWFLTFYFVIMTAFDIVDLTSKKISIYLSKKYSNISSKYFEDIIELLIITPLVLISFYYSHVLHGKRLIFNIETAFFCLGLVYCGKLIAKYYKDIAKKIDISNIFVKIVFLLLIIVIAVIWYKSSMYNGRIDLNARDYKNAILFYINSILGFILLSFLTYITSFIPIIKQLFILFGMNSIYILAYHNPSKTIIFNNIVPHFPYALKSPLLSNSIYSILVLTSLQILLSLIMAVIHRFIKRLIKKQQLFISK